MKQSIKRRALLVAASSLLAAMPAGAANSFYAAGDLVLFFQQAGGTNTVYANLGNAATQFRGAAAGAADASTTRINFLDLNSTLSSAFGGGWASDPTVFAGLAGVYSTNNTSSALVNGDPYRTLYVSAPRDSVGMVGDANSTAWVIGGNTAMTDAASGIQSMNNVFENNYNAAATISLTSISQIDDQNGFIAPGIQAAAFNTFDGGIQQQGSASSFGSFGAAGNVEFALDLYRILAKNTVPGQVAGELRIGSYEGTVTIGSTGMVSYIPEPSALALGGLAAGALVLRRRRSA